MTTAIRDAEHASLLAEIRREMDRLAGEILRTMHSAPDDFDALEPLYMRREDLRDELAQLAA